MKNCGLFLNMAKRCFLFAFEVLMDLCFLFWFFSKDWGSGEVARRATPLGPKPSLFFGGLFFLFYFLFYFSFFGKFFLFCLFFDFWFLCLWKSVFPWKKEGISVFNVSFCFFLVCFTSPFHSFFLVFFIFFFLVFVFFWGGFLSIYQPHCLIGSSQKRLVVKHLESSSCRLNSCHCHVSHAQMHADFKGPNPDQ